MKLKKYCFVAARNRGKRLELLSPEETKTVNFYSLIGETEDGEVILTSTVVAVENGIVRTQSGSLYVLGEMHPDYQKYNDAFEKGITILKQWEIKNSILRGFDSKSHERIEGKILSQDLGRNIISIETESGTENVFVDWLNISSRQNEFMMRRGYNSMKNAPEFCYKKAPDLFGANEEILRRKYLI